VNKITPVPVTMKAAAVVIRELAARTTLLFGSTGISEGDATTLRSVPNLT
jgi:hypothetical protein